MRLNNLYIIIIALLLVTLPSWVMAQDSDAPIEISADQTLEWNQKDKQYVANGNVVVVQGTLTLKADRVVADYHDDESKKSVQTENSPNIWQLTATGNVQIIDTGRTLYCDQAVYNVEDEFATATGQGLKLKTDDMSVTARDKMTFDAKKNIAKAIGKAHLIRGQDDIYANTLTATLANDKDGKMSLQSARADGNVKITTAEEILTGNKGIYDLTNNMATITGNVSILRGQNRLNGEKATLNLKTSVSKMFAAPNASTSGSKGRVKGIFYPGTTPLDKKSNKQQEEQGQ